MLHEDVRTAEGLHLACCFKYPGSVFGADLFWMWEIKMQYYSGSAATTSHVQKILGVGKHLHVFFGIHQGHALSGQVHLSSFPRDCGL